ncbi:hypothetical protein [Microseira sp. BLCC-F43]
MWIGLQDGRVVMEDAQTGKRLLTSGELEEQTARLAELLRPQGIDPDQV